MRGSTPGSVHPNFTPAKPVQIGFAGSLGREIGQNLANHARELEAMTRAGRCGGLHNVKRLVQLDSSWATIHIWNMTKTSRQRPRSSRGKGKPPNPPGFRSPVRLSIDHDALAALDKRAIAAQVGIGVAAGWLASWLVGGSGLLQYIVTGLAGSLIGGFLLERLGIDLGIRSQLASRIVTATLGAVIVVLVARLIG